MRPPTCHPDRKPLAKGLCAPCYRRQWLDRNLDYKVNWRRQAIYGISPARFAAMMIEQKGLCAICFRTMDPICVDHNHSTQRVRGLLCQGCNKAIGHAKESIPILRSAIVYLKHWSNS